MVHHPAKSRSFGSFSRGTGALALALCLSAAAYAQEQQDQQQGQQADQQQSQDPPAKPTYASQDADKPPYSHDGPVQNVPGAPSQPSQSVPGTLTVPAGTILLIRMNDYLSSDRSKIGDQFTAVLDQPLVVNGWVVARRGQVLVGQVKEVRQAGRIKGTSELGVELTDMTTVDGRQVPILTELWKASGGTSHGQDAATVGTTTGLGAVIGAAADWGRGAAIGAGAGAAAGLTPRRVSRRSSPSPSRILTADCSTGGRAALPVATQARTPTPAVTMGRVMPIPVMWDFMASTAGVTTAAAVFVTEPAEYSLGKA